MVRQDMQPGRSASKADRPLALIGLGLLAFGAVAVRGGWYAIESQGPGMPLTEESDFDHGNHPQVKSLREKSSQFIADCEVRCVAAEARGAWLGGGAAITSGALILLDVSGLLWAVSVALGLSSPRPPDVIRGAVSTLCVVLVASACLLASFLSTASSNRAMELRGAQVDALENYAILDEKLIDVEDLDAIEAAAMLHSDELRKIAERTNP